MKLIVLFVFTTISVSSLFAQKEIQSLIDYHKSVKSMEGTFTEEKTMPQLKAPIQSSGVFVFQGKNMRWEQQKPENHIIAIYGTSMQVKEEGKVRSYDLKGNKRLNMLREMMLNLSDGSFLNDERFSRTVTTKNQQIIVDLIPQKSQLKNYIEKIILEFDQTTKQLKTFVIVEKQGVVTEVNLKLTYKNRNISTAKFKL